jgi:LysM repeat protein
LGILSGKIPLNQVGVQGLNLILNDVGQPILDMFGQGMSVAFPQLLWHGQLYSWDTVRSPHGDADMLGAREDPRTAIGYMAAASIANPARFALVISGLEGLDRFPPSPWGRWPQRDGYEPLPELDGYGQDTYTVKKGDTLSGIAQSYGITLAQIEAANPQIANFDLITPGESINIPDTSDSSSGDGTTSTTPDPSVPAVPDGGGGTDPGSNSPPPPQTSNQPSGIMGLVSSAITMITKFAGSIMSLFGIGTGNPVPSGAGAQTPPTTSSDTTPNPSTAAPTSDNSGVILLAVGVVIYFVFFSGEGKKASP